MVAKATIPSLTRPVATRISITVASWGKPQRVIGTAEEIAKTQQRSDWRRLSAAAGTKGPRLHDWCYLELGLTITARSFGHVAC